MFRGMLLAAACTAAANAQTFADGLYAYLQKANCRACHVENGVASATRLHFPNPDASGPDVEAFGRSLAVLVDRANPDQSLLLLKPTARIKHTGGKLIPPGSPAEAALIAWIQHLATLPPDAPAEAHTGARPKAPPGLVRRLTHTQYNHTLRDLLAEQTAPASQFPQEDFVNGFKNQAEAQGIPALLAESYGAAAEKVARNAFRTEEGNPLIPCRPRSATDAECRAKFLAGFGLKAFRRPLTAREMARYTALFDGEARRTGRFAAGAQLAVEAMLQSPNFLLRVESKKLYAVASRLSYALWDSIPDEALFRAAAAGKIDVEREARRMIDDPRAREALDEFMSQWLRYDRLLGSVKDRRMFPMFTPETALSMLEETRRFVDDVVWNDRNFMRIFDADYTFVNADLAAIYNLPEPKTDFERAVFPADSDRAGILGQATFLALTSKPADTSPTARGLFVREQFLCQHVPDPPPGTNSVLPPVSEDKPMTNRDRLGVHLTKELCAGCHKLIDPIGFGFEKFDAIGSHREKAKLVFLPGRHERSKKMRSMEVALDTHGSLAGVADSEFSTPKELGRILARTPQCQECVVKQYFRYIYGRPETAADRPVIQAALARFRDSGFRFRELMAAVTTAYAREIE